jgi:hypothetical protein
MSADPSRRFELPENTSAVASPSTNTRNGAMLFRIVGPHQHRAVLGKRIFSCERETITTDEKLSTLWSAFDGKTLLKGDCRTLNEAKNLCRGAASAEPRRAY